MTKNTDKLTNESIEKLISDKENLDFTGKYYLPNEEIYDTHTPLTFAIETNNEKLFKKLVNAKADINHAIEKWGWTPLLYALKSENIYFLKELLEEKSLDVYKKISDDNAIMGVLTSSQLSYCSVKNVVYALDYLKKQRNIENLLDNSTNILENRLDDNSCKLLLKKAPKQWLKEQLNYSLPVAIKTLKRFSHNKTLINKTILLLEPNKIFKENETVLNYFVTNNLHSLRPVEKNNDEYIVENLLRMGHNEHLSINQKALDILKIKNFYKNYTIEKNYIKLNQLITENKVISKKIKI